MHGSGEVPLPSSMIFFLNGGHLDQLAYLISI